MKKYKEILYGKISFEKVKKWFNKNKKRVVAYCTVVLVIVGTGVTAVIY